MLQRFWPRNWPGRFLIGVVALYVAVTVLTIAVLGWDAYFQKRLAPLLAGALFICLGTWTLVTKRRSWTKTVQRPNRSGLAMLLLGVGGVLSGLPLSVNLHATMGLMTVGLALVALILVLSSVGGAPNEAR